MVDRESIGLRSVLGGLFLFACGVSWAAGGEVETVRTEPFLLAGEIILVPSKNNTSPSDSEARRQKDAAREYRKGQSAPPAVIVVPDDDGGMLSPRRGVSGAAENVARARDSRQGDANGAAVTPSIVMPEEGASAGSESPAAQSAKRERSRAIEYRTGGQRSHSVATAKGTDGLPIVDCSSVDNVAGRIGDDTRSGSVIILIQDRNQVKVRCR